MKIFFKPSRAAAAIMSCKKVKRDVGEEGYNYFQNLPDELIITIFAKLSSACGLVTLDEIKCLGQCSTVSKRFNSLTSLVPTLSISYPCVGVLCISCPKILDKFKHIRSLRLAYRSDTKGVEDGVKYVPLVCSKAIYDPPHNYSLAVTASTDVYVYPRQQEQYPTRSLTTATEDEKEVIRATGIYASGLFHLHHMLLSSIRDHKVLQKVVVTDWMQRESFTLVEKQLVQLRNINANDAQVQGFHSRGFCNIMCVPLSAKGGHLFKNVTFSLVKKWRENSTGRHDDDIPQFEGTGIVFNGILEKMLKMEEDLDVNYELVPKVVLKNNWV